jgi:hypothetical protein
MKKILFGLVISTMICMLVLNVFVPVSLDAAGADCGNKICNPLKVDNIQDLIKTVLEFVVNLLAIAGVLYVMYAGFLMVKAQGNPEELKKAKQAFLNAIIGLGIILGAWAISIVIKNTINKVTSNNTNALRP